MSASYPLRKTGPFISPLKVLNDTAEPPRALKSLAQIIDNDLCHRCGSCVGICPTQVLGLDGQEFPQVKNLSACTDCDLCVRVCPGDEFSAPSIAKELFNTVPEIYNTHGHIEEASITYAVDKGYSLSLFKWWIGYWFAFVNVGKWRN